MPSVIRAETTKLISLMAYSEQQLGPALQRKQVSALWAAHASSLPATGKSRQARSSGINLECCYTTCRTGITLHWARGFEMEALILLSNSIFYVHLVFIKGIKTNIPWEYKIPAKVISVNEGRKMRLHTTVISWSHTSQASYIPPFLNFRNAERANCCCLYLGQLQNQHCGGWDGQTQDILAVNFCRCPAYENTLLQQFSVCNQLPPNHKKQANWAIQMSLYLCSILFLLSTQTLTEWAVLKPQHWNKNNDTK